MADTNDTSTSNLGNWQLPALLIALFTFLGISTGDSRSPAGSRPENEARPNAEAAAAENEKNEARMDLVDEFRPLSPSAMLAALDPLVQFYASEIAQKREAGKDAPPKAADPKKSAQNQTLDSLKAEKTLGYLAEILRSESRKFRDRRSQENKPSAESPGHASTPAIPVSLKTLVGIVPDPKSSGIAYQYDSAIFGIRSAFGKNEFVLHSHSIPWAYEEKGSRSASTDEHKSTAENLLLPGAILFRKPVEKNGTFFDSGSKQFDTDSPFELGLVLLVPEKPLSGIDAAMFLKALEIAEFLNKAVSGTAPGVKEAEPNPIRVFGPNFSGSDVSILQVLRRWIERNGKKWKESAAAKGMDPESDRVVMLWNNGDALKFAPATYEIPLEDNVESRLIHYRTFGPRDSDYVKALTEYIRKSLSRLDWNRKIAIVSEGSTTYGAQSKSMDSVVNQNTDVNEKDQKGEEVKILQYRYPLNIAEMRRRVEKSRKRGDDPNLRIRTAEQIELDLGNDLGSGELIKYATPEYSVSVDELRILRVVEDIRFRKIRYVIVRSSDVRDLIFICEFIRKHCPDIQILAVNSDITLNHSERIVNLRGLVVASGFSTFAGEWNETNVQKTTGKIDFTIDKQKGRGDVFPDSTAAANNIAVSEHLKWDIPGSLGDDSKAYPVKISVNSQKGFLPLGAFVPRDAAEADKGNDKPKEPVKLNRKWNRFPVTSGVSVFLTIPIFMMSLSILYWYRIRFERTVMQLSAVSAILGRESRYPVSNDHRTKDRIDRKTASPGKVSSQWSAAENQGKSRPESGSDYLGKLQNSAKSFLDFLKFRASAFDHFHLLWNWNTLRLITIPIMLLIFCERFQSYQDYDHIDLSLPSMPGFALCLLLAGNTDRIARLTRQSSAIMNWHYESGGLRLLRYFLTLHVIMFVWFAITQVSTFELWLIEGILIAMISFAVATVAVMTYRINLVWNLFSSISTNIQSLPMGDVFERLPRRLTSKPGDFNEIWFENNDAELNPRIGQILNRTREMLYRNLDRIELRGEFENREERNPAAKNRSAEKSNRRKERQKPDENQGETAEKTEKDISKMDEFEFSHRLVRSVLKPVWDSRLSSEAYADKDERPEGATPDQLAANRADAELESQAETLVAIMLVHFVNRGMDLVWTFIITTILLALLMMVMISSYPFQPAGSLQSWTLLFVFLAIVSCFRVYFGMNRDGLLSRVHRTPNGKSIFDSDFLGKGLLYLAPMLTLLSSLSLGVSEVIRIVLLPLFS